MKVLLIVGILVGAAVLYAQNEPNVLKVDSNNITVEVSVTDSANRPVVNLSKDDFRIYEDGKLQDLRGFYPVDTPCSILLLFDRSTSTMEEWPLLQTSLDHFIDTLSVQDRIAIATFADKATLRLDWWDLSKGRPGDVLSAAKLENHTYFYESVNWALNKIRKVNTRKGIVFLTDGIDSSSTMHVFPPEQDQDFQRLIRNVWAGNVPIYFVALNTDVNSQHANPAGRVRMELLAENSGGSIVYPKTASDVTPFFASIAHNLGTQYGLAYQQPLSSRDGKRHTIEVQLRDRGLTTHLSRDHYTAN